MVFSQNGSRPTGIELDRRRFLGYALGVGLAVGTPGLLTACGSGGSAGETGSTEGTLRFLSEDTADVEAAWYKKANAAFKQKYPDVKVDSEYLAQADFLQKLQTQIASRNLIDFVPRSGLPRLVTLYSQGVLDPVDDIAAKIGIDDFLPGTLDAFTVNGKLIGIPLQTLGSLFWYRKDLASQANAKPPSNWDELLTFAKALTRDNVYGVIVPTGPNPGTARLFLSFIRQNGGNIVDEDLKVAFDSPENVETLTFLQELSRYSPPGSPSYGFPEQLSVFTSGGSASTYFAGRTLQVMQEDAPKLAPQLGFVPYPTNSQPWAYSEPSGPYIFKSAERRDLARRWITEIQFDKNLHLKWLNTAPGMNLAQRKSVVQDSAYAHNPLLQQYPHALEMLTKAAATGGNFAKESPEHSLNSQAGVLDSGIILSEVLQRAIVKKQSPKSALSWGQSKISELMEDAAKL